jgi:hypothetical protein
MVDKLLDMDEDASTEAGSTESAEGLSSFGSGSRSEDLSDEGSLQESRPSLGGVAGTALLADASVSRTAWGRWGANRQDTSFADTKASHASSEALRQLVAMGFSEAAAQSALDHTGHRGVDAAVTFLVDGITV